MAAISIQALKDLQLSQKLPVWRVTTGTDKIPINAQNDNSMPVEESANLLERFLQTMTGDFVVVKLYERAPKNRSQEIGATPEAYQVRVRLNNFSQSQPITGAPQNLDTLFALKDEIANLKIEQIRREMEEREPSPFMRLVDKLSENQAFVGALTTVLMKVAVPAAPTPVVAKPQPEPGQNNINEILQRLQKIEPDPVQLLHDLTVYIEKNPSVLPQVKALIQT